SREFRLQEMITIVDSQQITLIYLILFLIVLLALAILIYFAYRGRKRDAKRLLEQKEELSELVKELHQTQSQLVQSEKMASLGVLTAGIAHEINNAINFVYSGIQILEMKFSVIKPVLMEVKDLSIEDSGFKNRIKSLIAEKERVGYNESQELIDQMIANIQIGVERTTEIVKGLRTFSRSEEEEKTKIKVHKEIEVALLLLKSRYKDVIRIEKKFTKGTLEIDGYQGQLGQAFLNIINNAIDAVYKKGKQGKITISTSVKNRFVIISMQDNGVGIPREIKEKIFDPFFTTKKVGAGTGLGLSITYGIVEKHGGVIDVISKKYGSEFIIKLPLAVA
ncbi:MAG: ATP-binding protein, partial [Bacteroidota bacterium]